VFKHLEDMRRMFDVDDRILTGETASLDFVTSFLLVERRAVTCPKDRESGQLVGVSNLGDGL